MSAEVLGRELRAGCPCPHASAAGCGVYDRRPEVPCRSFVCSWLVEGSPLPDWMRPDLSGAIVLLSLPWEGERVISAIPVGPRIPQRTLDWLMAYARKTGRPLIFYERLTDEQGRYCGLKRFGFGNPEFRAKVARVAASGAEPVVPMESI